MKQWNSKKTMKNNKCEMNYFEWMVDQFWNSIIQPEKNTDLNS